MIKFNLYLLCVMVFALLFSSFDNALALDTIPKEIRLASSSIHIMAGGDLMLDRWVRTMIDRKGIDYPFVEIKKITKDSDLFISNLEGSFTTFAPKKLAVDMLSFTFDQRILPALKTSGFNVFNLANNHTLNFGKKGLEQSKNFITKSGLNYFGDPYNKKDIGYVIEKNGYKIALIGYNQFTANKTEKVVEEIERLHKQADVVIVMTHWGNEYAMNFNKGQQKLGRLFVDAGADVILGTHPHVIEPIEMYKGRPIFYSLGNLLFDQDFSKKTKRGLLLDLEVQGRQMRCKIRPIDIQKAQIKLTTVAETMSQLAELSKNFVGDEKFLQEIGSGEVQFELSR